MGLDRLWGKIKVRDKMQRHVAVPLESLDTWGEALNEICRELDVERPMAFAKHEIDMAQFHMARFFADSFLDRIAFDCLEIEILFEDKKKDKAKSGPHF